MNVLLQRSVFVTKGDFKRDFFHAEKDAMMKEKKRLMENARPFTKGNARFMQVVPRVFPLEIYVVR